MAAQKKKQFIRPKKGRIVGGVALAIANYFAIDTTLVRAIWVILMLSGGSGVLAYIVLWLIIPEEK